ncbi:hypothetical protein [Alteromonas facilis]|uniref:hypothetical protein n=1 Tax=Alteromonas facilis TaxID=2048004 RepID=UPI000C28632F|nr:hypothetical protein [Alteromonas facilis]
MFTTPKSSAGYLLVFSLLWLSGCASTGGDDDSGLLGNFGNMLSSNDDEKPLWANEPLVTQTMCDSFTLENITSFTNTYARNEQLNAGSSAEQAGKQAMDTYSLAAVLVNRAQLCMAEALELKDVTDTLLLEREILTSGTSMSEKEIEKHREYSASASTEIMSYSNQIDSITPEQRKLFLLGITTYLTGSYTTAKIEDAVATYTEKASDSLQRSTQAASNSTNKVAGWLNAAVEVFNTSASGGSRLYSIGSGLVPHLQKLYETGEYLIEYASENDIELPDNATTEFLALGGWNDA